MLTLCRFWDTLVISASYTCDTLCAGHNDDFRNGGKSSLLVSLCASFHGAFPSCVGVVDSPGGCTLSLSCKALGVHILSSGRVGIVPRQHNYAGHMHDTASHPTSFWSPCAHLHHQLVPNAFVDWQDGISLHQAKDTV